MTGLEYPERALTAHVEAKAIIDLQHLLDESSEVTIEGSNRPCPHCRGLMNAVGIATGATIIYRWQELSWEAKR